MTVGEPAPGDPDLWRANARRNERQGPNWRLHTLDRIPDLPVLRVLEELRKYAAA